MKPSKKYLIAVSIAFVAIFCAYKLWNYYLLGPWTRDGRIRVEIIEVSAEVSGRLINLPIADNQRVNKGDLLLEIEPADYELATTIAQAQLEQLRSQQSLAQAQFDRRVQLSSSASISAEDLDISRTTLKDLNNQIKQAEASLDKAQLDLKRTKLYAEEDGYITNLALREGNIIAAGQPLLALVDRNSFYAIAYFEETKMPFVAIGKTVDVFPYDGSRKMRGTITGFGRAIVDQSAATGRQMVSDVRPNYPWVALAQRIPVRIELDKTDLEARAHDLIAGSTCTVAIVD
ncbi:MAG: efflux RND transporter periplasmic adaptor subunit [Candidatus Adiutrix sp.]